jgi:hypothetical protein
VGFDIDGMFCPAHEFLNANNLIVPYTQVFNLPVRMEIRNTGAATGTPTIQFICCSVQSEGGEEDRGFPRSANNAITEISCDTTGRPVISIRPAATYNGVTNRAHIEEVLARVNIESGKALWELRTGGTLTGASWVGDAVSCAEIDVSATAISGSRVIASGYLSGGGATASETTSSFADIKNPLVLSQIDALAPTQRAITLFVRAQTGTVLALGALNWNEQVI